jgi:hypothetical protein
MEVHQVGVVVMQRRGGWERQRRGGVPGRSWGDMEARQIGGMVDWSGGDTEAQWVRAVATLMRGGSEAIVIWRCAWSGRQLDG